jgi:hypothetical protein
MITAVPHSSCAHHTLAEPAPLVASRGCIYPSLQPHDHAQSMLLLLYPHIKLVFTFSLMYPFPSCSNSLVWYLRRCDVHLECYCCPIVFLSSSEPMRASSSSLCPLTCVVDSSLACVFHITGCFPCRFQSRDSCLHVSCPSCTLASFY